MRTSKTLILLTLSFFIGSDFRAFAEYRAFKLQLQTKDGQILKEFNSTLDPDQYRGFHAISYDQKLIYTRTWMCRGRTDLEPICPEPEEPPSTSSRSPSSDQKEAPPP